MDQLAITYPYATLTEMSGETIKAVLTEPIPALTEAWPEAPVELDEVVAKALARDREDLFGRVFAAYNGVGRTKTFFKPESPGYWQRQPGRPVKPADLHFSSR